MNATTEFESCDIPEIFESASSCGSLPAAGASAQPIPSGTMIGMLRELEVKL